MKPLVDSYPAPVPVRHTSVQPALLAGAFRRSGLETPSYVLSYDRLRENGRILRDIQERTGAKILLAQKAFSCPAVYPTLREYLAGTTASGLYEARLGYEEFGGEVHVFSPAYKDREMEELVEISDHIVFNSLNQWRRHAGTVHAAGRPISVGLRINPGYAEATAAIYDPCAPGSRFGVREDALELEDLEGIDGLHFHALCQQNSYALERVLRAAESRFAPFLERVEWLNLGGGHLLTSPDYDVDHLCDLLADFGSRFPHLQIYLEPGEAVASEAGWLVGSVIDVVENGMQVAVLDISATTHMPDVLEMPYRPEVQGGGLPGERAFTYRLAGPTCLSGDVIGDYSFDQPLEPGDQIIFEDMAHYTMVKNSTFNGVPLPSISVLQNEHVHLIRQFGYEVFRNRLG